MRIPLPVFYLAETLNRHNHPSLLPLVQGTQPNLKAFVLQMSFGNVGVTLNKHGCNHMKPSIRNRTVLLNMPHSRDGTTCQSAPLSSASPPDSSVGENVPHIEKADRFFSWRGCVCGELIQKWNKVRERKVVRSDMSCHRDRFHAAVDHKHKLFCWM